MAHDADEPAATTTDDVAALRARVAELEAREAEHERSERVQAALYRISEAASGASDLQAFYREVQATVGMLMPAENFYIALYDAQRQAINFPYYVDTVDLDLPDPAAWEPFGVGNARGTTAYLLRKGRPIRLGTADFLNLVAAGELEEVGLTTPESEWLGAPLVADGRTIGAVVSQTYTGTIRFADGDLDVLAFVGQHIGAALTRVRALEETRQRNAELSLVNEIGQALAAQLEFSAIIELVGDRVSTIFETKSLFIALHDPERDTLTFPYDMDEGVQFDRGEFPVGPGLTSTVLRTGRSIRIGSVEEQEAAGAVNVGGSDTQSWLGAPIPAGNRVIGVVGLESLRSNAFGEADERLLNTLSASMGVALENARLFDETKRLLTETNERAAELSVINEIGAALARQLDYQAIVELVGRRVGEIFRVRSLHIDAYDEAAGMITFPYAIEGGEPLQPTPIPFGPGLTSEVIRSRTPLNIGSNDAIAAQGAILFGQTTQSWLGVPILAGDRVLGVIALESFDRDAFDDGDVRLLSTLATSMGVALENARLFNETKRLLAETNERAAELALINDVQHGLAERLDMQAMYDLVGDRIQAIFDAQVVDIGVIDRVAALIHYPYAIERGIRYPDEPTPIRSFRKQVIESGKPLRLGEAELSASMALGETVIMQGEPARSMLIAPLFAGTGVSGVISLQNLDRDDAFSESDVELLTTLASSLSVALENVRLIEETRQRLAELATVNEVGKALATQLDLDPLIQLVGDQMRRTFEADIVYVALHDVENGRIEFPYYNEHGSSTGQGADSVRQGPDLEDHRQLRDSPAEPRSGLGCPRDARRRDALEVLPRRPDHPRRPVHRRDQRPEHNPGGPVRRIGLAPAVDDRRQRRRRDPERPALPRGASPGR